MNFLLPIALSLVVFGFALLIKHLFLNILEGGRAFLCVIGAFFVVYIVAAIAMGYVMPTVSRIPGDVEGSESAEAFR